MQGLARGCFASKRAVVDVAVRRSRATPQSNPSLDKVETVRSEPMQSAEELSINAMF
jgi:hypothetical protein